MRFCGQPGGSQGLFPIRWDSVRGGYLFLLPPLVFLSVFPATALPVNTPENPISGPFSGFCDLAEGFRQPDSAISKSHLKSRVWGSRGPAPWTQSLPRASKPQATNTSFAFRDTESCEYRQGLSLQQPAGQPRNQSNPAQFGGSAFPRSRFGRTRLCKP